MKLRQLKDLLNSIPDQDLDKNILYNSSRWSISGVIEKVEIAKKNLYNTGEDDPAKLYSKKELKEKGLNKEEIEGIEIEIPKGAVVFNF